MKKLPQRKLDNINNAFAALKKAAHDPIVEDRDLSGIIKDFEIVYELSWKLLKIILEDQGQMTVGPRDVISKAFQFNIIHQEEVWASMIVDRNLTVHTYNKKLAQEMVARIKDSYIKAFELFCTNISKY